MTTVDRSSDNTWEKARAVSTILATVVIPLAIALSGHWYGQLQKDKELQLKYIELSLKILSDEPTDTNQAVRGWAIDTINQYAEIKIDSDTREQLLREQLRSMEQIVQTISEVANTVSASQ
ncbi:MAG: hypothetical protein JSU95_14190 [Betaproteobacteria bacterium]|nr:MAG: hypothetical protein JSU95_14190 [Betaproteobacteria bacterium]